MVQKVLYAALAAVMITLFTASLATAKPGGTSADGCHKHKSDKIAHCPDVTVERMNVKYNKSGNNDYRVVFKDGTIAPVGGNVSISEAVVSALEAIENLQRENSALIAERDQLRADLEAASAAGEATGLSKIEAYKLCFEAIESVAWASTAASTCKGMNPAVVPDFVECFQFEEQSSWSSTAIQNCKELLNID